MVIKRRQVVHGVVGMAAAAVCPRLISSSFAAVTGGGGAGQILVDPTVSVSSWKSNGPRPRPDWKNERVDGVDAISVTAQASVGILHRPVSADLQRNPLLCWRWRATALPAGADLNSTEADDVGAGIALVFGEVGLLKKQPPMLIYVWAASANEPGEIVSCIRHPKTMRFVVVENGLTPLGQWREGRRNIIDDYKKAFGASPAQPIRSVALWADSDQTGGETVAAFGPATLQPS